MRVTVLCENTALCDHFYAEHGLSLFVETRQDHFLFDMGQTDVFSKNAAQLGISLKDAEFAVLSHGHYDHTGGLALFLEQNKTAPVYISGQAFAPFYNADQKFIGTPSHYQSNTQIKLTDDLKIINERIALFSCNGLNRPFPFPAFGLTIKAGKEQIDDPFYHEQYLLLRENGKRILISGCSHKGVLNLMNWFRPDILIGGFHTMKVDPETKETQKYLSDFANQLLRYDAVYYTGHCTGEEQFAFLKSIMKDHLQAIHSGERIIINE